MLCQQPTTRLQSIFVNVIRAGFDVNDDLFSYVFRCFDLIPDLYLVEFLAAPVYLFIADA